MPNFRHRPQSSPPPSALSPGSQGQPQAAEQLRPRTAFRRAKARVKHVQPEVDMYPGLPGADMPLAVRRMFMQFVERQRRERRDVEESEATTRTALYKKIASCVKDMACVVRLQQNKAATASEAWADQRGGKFPAGFRNSVIRGSTWEGVVRRTERHGGGELFDSEAKGRIATELRESQERRALMLFRVAAMRAIWSPIEIAALMHQERRARRYFQKRLYAQHRLFLEKLTMDLWACVDVDGHAQTRRLQAMVERYHAADECWPTEPAVMAGHVRPHPPCECFERYPKRGPAGWQRFRSPAAEYPVVVPQTV